MKRSYFLYGLLLVLFGISIVWLYISDISEQPKDINDQADVLDIITVMPTKSSSIVNHEETSIPMNTSTPTIEPTNTMKSCEELVIGTPLKTQASYQGLYPGISTKEVVEQVLGKSVSAEPSPNSEGEGTSEQTQFPFVEIAYDSYGVVVEIRTDYGFEENTNLTLIELINLYGCPDLIFAINMNEDTMSETQPYNDIKFVYTNLGLDALIERFYAPAPFENDVYLIRYFIPTTVTQYLRANESLNDPFYAKRIIWDELLELLP